jgi:hypothetical protein
MGSEDIGGCPAAFPGHPDRKSERLVEALPATRLAERDPCRVGDKELGGQHADHAQRLRLVHGRRARSVARRGHQLIQHDREGPCRTGWPARRRACARYNGPPRRVGREVCSSWCISSACCSSVQVSSKNRWRFSSWQRTDKTGEPVAADNVWAQASPGQAGLPPASCVAAAPSRPVSQA